MQASVLTSSVGGVHYARAFLLPSYELSVGMLLHDAFYQDMGLQGFGGRE
jgi:hypothetical protein